MSPEAESALELSEQETLEQKREKILLDLIDSYSKREESSIAEENPFGDQATALRAEKMLRWTLIAKVAGGVLATALAATVGGLPLLAAGVTAAGSLAAGYAGRLAVDAVRRFSGAEDYEEGLRKELETVFAGREMNLIRLAKDCVQASMHGTDCYNNPLTYEQARLDFAKCVVEIADSGTNENQTFNDNRKALKKSKRIWGYAKAGLSLITGVLGGLETGEAVRSLIESHAAEKGIELTSGGLGEVAKYSEELRSKVHLVKELLHGDGSTEVVFEYNAGEVGHIKDVITSHSELAPFFESTSHAKALLEMGEHGLHEAGDKLAGDFAGFVSESASSQIHQTVVAVTGVSAAIELSEVLLSGDFSGNDDVEHEQGAIKDYGYLDYELSQRPLAQNSGTAPEPPSDEYIDFGGTSQTSGGGAPSMLEEIFGPLDPNTSGPSAQDDDENGRLRSLLSPSAVPPIPPAPPAQPPVPPALPAQPPVPPAPPAQPPVLNPPEFVPPLDEEGGFYEEPIEQQPEPGSYEEFESKLTDEQRTEIMASVETVLKPSSVWEKHPVMNMIPYRTISNPSKALRAEFNAELKTKILNIVKREDGDLYVVTELPSAGEPVIIAAHSFAAIFFNYDLSSNDTNLQTARYVALNEKFASYKENMSPITDSELHRLYAKEDEEENSNDDLDLRELEISEPALNRLREVSDSFDVAPSEVENIAPERVAEMREALRVIWEEKSELRKELEPVENKPRVVASMEFEGKRNGINARLLLFYSEIIYDSLPSNIVVFFNGTTSDLSAFYCNESGEQFPVVFNKPEGEGKEGQEVESIMLEHGESAEKISKGDEWGYEGDSPTLFVIRKIVPGKNGVVSITFDNGITATETPENWIDFFRPMYIKNSPPEPEA